MQSIVKNHPCDYTAQKNGARRANMPFLHEGEGGASPEAVCLSLEDFFPWNFDPEHQKNLHNNRCFFPEKILEESWQPSKLLADI